MRRLGIAGAINVAGSDAWHPSISLQLAPGFKTGRVQGVRRVCVTGEEVGMPRPQG